MNPEWFFLLLALPILAYFLLKKENQLSFTAKITQNQDAKKNALTWVSTFRKGIVYVKLFIFILLVFALAGPFSWKNNDGRQEDYKNGIVTTNGEDFYSDTLVWAAGVKGQMPGGIDASQIGKGNRIIVNDYCQSPKNENIYVLGDVALIESETYPNGLPMMASVAMQQGAYLAKTFNRLAKGKAVKPFVYNDKGSMATVGKNLAVVQTKRFKFQGIFAWFVWMFVHLFSLIGFRNKAIVFLNWVYNYVRFDRETRLIIRPYKNKNKYSFRGKL